VAGPSINFSPNPTPRTPSASNYLIQGPVSVEQNLAQAFVNQQVKYEEDDFWPRPITDSTKWDKYCPYQLIVVEYVLNTPVVPENGGIYQPYLDWQYTLPLPPESMHISTPFAINTTVTLNGIVEEHNAAPIRMISFRGTTGFLPSRSSGASRSGTGAIGQLESIFGGTVNTVGSAIGSINKAIGAAANSAPEAYNVYSQAEFDSSTLLVNTSGFNQMALLRDFLESYAAIKKNNKDLGSRLRLAVAIWKENQVFLVTPVGFDVMKDASSPLEYKYSLNFKAWKRIELDAGNLTEVSPTPIRHSPNAIARAINTLTAARQAVQKFGTLKQGVLGDVDYVFKPFHDTILLGKDLLGASLSLAEIPLAVKQRVTVNVLELKYNSKALWDQLSSSQTYDSSLKALKYTFDDNSHIQDMPVGTRSSTTNTSQNSGRASTTSSAGRKANIRLKDIPDDLSSQIPISALSLPQDAKNDILKDLNRVRGLRRKDFEDYANTIRSTADKIAFMVGAGDPTYAEVYGIDVIPIKSEPTQSDWDSLNALNSAVDVLRQFAATADGEPEQSPTFLERFGGLAVASGIAWKQPVSKFAIPFPYGATLEGLASIYLKDPNRFMEIVALNGLRAPYVDETGYTIPLLVNGKDKTIVANYKDDLYVGKTVWLSSTSANRVQYHIESIQTSNGVSALKLSDTVDSYRIADSAVLEAFLTGTVCSRNLIWIPSDVEPLDPESVITKDIPGVNVTDPMVSIGGVDLLLGTDLDLVLVDGDLRYAIGLANIVQWVRSILSIEKGELIQHKELGLPLSIGLSLADFSAQDILNAIKKQLSQDSTFSRIDKISVVQKGSGVSIDISALVAGTSQPLPLNYGMTLS
jgi:hypothetical protein